MPWQPASLPDDDTRPWQTNADAIAEMPKLHRQSLGPIFVLVTFLDPWAQQVQRLAMLAVAVSDFHFTLVISF